MDEYVKNWKTFLPLVKERPDPDLEIDKFKCVFCHSTNVETSPQGQTLVGGGKEDDPNHVWTKVKCNDCWGVAIHEHIGNNTWYTKHSVVLAGIPSCHEGYVYTCAHCGGSVNRHYYLSK